MLLSQPAAIAAACVQLAVLQEPGSSTSGCHLIKNTDGDLCVRGCFAMSALGPQEKAQAQGFANALSTIGKFVLKKKAGDKDQLYST